jgi:hypothetical protein
MDRKTKEFNVKEQLELHRWKDDGGSGERREAHYPGQGSNLARDARPGEAELPRPPNRGTRLRAQRTPREIPCGWQSKPIYPVRLRRQREVFLDFDPVCPEWPIAEDKD